MKKILICFIALIFLSSISTAFAQRTSRDRPRMESPRIERKRPDRSVREDKHEETRRLRKERMEMKKRAKDLEAPEDEAQALYDTSTTTQRTDTDYGVGAPRDPHTTNLFDVHIEGKTEGSFQEFEGMEDQMDVSEIEEGGVHKQIPKISGGPYEKKDDDD